MSISTIGNWLGSRWGGFPPWDRSSTTDGRAEEIAPVKSSQSAINKGIAAAFSAAPHCINVRFRNYGNLWKFIGIISARFQTVRQRRTAARPTAKAYLHFYPLSNRLIVLDLQLLHVLYYISLYRYLLYMIYRHIIIYYTLCETIIYIILYYAIWY